MVDQQTHSLNASGLAPAFDGKEHIYRVCLGAAGQKLKESERFRIFKRRCTGDRCADWF